jgi:hypothetical protein
MGCSHLRMSTYTLRSHYVFYSIFRSLNVGTNIDIADGTGSIAHRVFVPYATYLKSMAFEENEDSNQI